MPMHGARTVRACSEFSAPVQTALYASAALLGFAGLPHCTAMCSAPCAAAIGSGRRATLAFQLARLLAYTVAGAVVASAVGSLIAVSSWTPALRPLWTVLHLAALALGLVLLWRGRQPTWMAALGRTPPVLRPVSGPGPAPARASLVRASTAGGLWVLWPCGLLQSALTVAALGSGAADGAIVMAVFAAASAPGLLFGPWVVRRLLAGQRGGAAAYERIATRGAGLLLAGASAWALGHGLWVRVAALCGWA